VVVLPVEAPPVPTTAAPLPPLGVVAPPTALTLPPVPPAGAPMPPTGSEPELCVVLPHAADASPQRASRNNLHVVKPSMSPSCRAYARARRDGSPKRRAAALFRVPCSRAALFAAGRPAALARRFSGHERLLRRAPQAQRAPRSVRFGSIVFEIEFRTARLEIWRRIVAGLLSTLAVSCAASSPKARSNPRPAPPTFVGQENESWLVEETGPVDRDDTLRAFKAAARNFGCSTEELGNANGANILGEYRGYYGISASCAEGTIALITLEGGRVRIGCAKPTTIQACESLLRDISASR